MTMYPAACTEPVACQSHDWHAALFYEDQAQYVDGIMGFLAPALDAGEPIAIAVPSPRAQMLRDHIEGPGVDLEVFDMRELGANPARIIPLVLSMLERHAGQPLHYVGEPGWPGRSPAELHEVTRHEAMINLAWPDAPIRVLCPYDAAGLDEAFLRDAEVTHPLVMRDGTLTHSHRYGDARFPHGVDEPLSEPPAGATTIDFSVADLGIVRALVTERARQAGLARATVEDLVIAVNEVATNAIKYAPAEGRLQVWRTAEGVICQLDDRGHIADPLAGRHRPTPGGDGGVGLWMVNQLCDLVETRTGPAGTTIRLHAARRR